jgi:hypothetical protein
MRSKVLRMRGSKGRSGLRRGTLVEARCAWCGRIELDEADLHVHVGRGADALFDFRCPGCARVNIRPLSTVDVAALAELGITFSRGDAPFELLEERSGPPLSWDDLIEFHRELEGLSWGGGIQTDQVPGWDRGRERDAA